MLHFAMRARPGTMLFREWEEAHRLWKALVTRVACVAIVLMPDHVHVMLADEGPAEALHRGMRTYARWRNARRGESGPVWQHRDAPKAVREGQHGPRTIRYIFLNPCRARLVRDPLSWPFSSYRDALGLALPALHRAWPDPEKLHAQVSADRWVKAEGTELPVDPPFAGSPSLVGLFAAVSSLTRTPAAAMRREGLARRLFVRAARDLGRASSRDVAALLGVSATTVRTSWREPVPGLDRVARVVGDPRFALLIAGDLRRLATWRRYSRLR